jgi:tRNA(Ile2) C34 agmatinyltransferase TiaS
MNERPKCKYCGVNEAFIGLLGEWICGDCLMEIKNKQKEVIFGPNDKN